MKSHLERISAPGEFPELSNSTMARREGIIRPFATAISWEGQNSRSPACTADIVHDDRLTTDQCTADGNSEGIAAHERHRCLRRIQSILRKPPLARPRVEMSWPEESKHLQTVLQNRGLG